MAPSDDSLDIIRCDEVTPEQAAFINRWSEAYFGEIVISEDYAKAPVHWRLLLRDDDLMVSQVAITELQIEFDGKRLTVGALGGLFTAEKVQGRGYASSLMDQAEAFIFDTLKFPMGILFCLPSLVPFYSRRKWTEITRPVSLAHKNGDQIWGAAVMILFPDKAQTGDHAIHVPHQPKG
ncbi:MAG: hypothetical protein CMO55_05365 [Verrucomicrobiales bacterium]|nr:hypothetical protein [Verrucomicrobiales bacterium]